MYKKLKCKSPGKSVHVVENFGVAINYNSWQSGHLPRETSCTIKHVVKTYISNQYESRQMIDSLRKDQTLL